MPTLLPACPAPLATLTKVLGLCLKDLDAIAQLNEEHRTDPSEDVPSMLIDGAGQISALGIDALVAFAQFVSTSFELMQPSIAGQAACSGSLWAGPAYPDSLTANLGPSMASRIEALEFFAEQINLLRTDAQELISTRNAAQRQQALGGLSANVAKALILGFRTHLGNISERIDEAVGKYWSPPEDSEHVMNPGSTAFPALQPMALAQGAEINVSQATTADIQRLTTAGFSLGAALRHLLTTLAQGRHCRAVNNLGQTRVVPKSDCAPRLH